MEKDNIAYLFLFSTVLGINCYYLKQNFLYLPILKKKLKDIGNDSYSPSSFEKNDKFKKNLDGRYAVVSGILMAPEAYINVIK